MNAILYSHDNNNAALQGDSFRLSPEAVAAVAKVMRKAGKLTAGSYWAAHTSCARRDARNGFDGIVHTAGFGCAEFCHFLRDAGVTLTTTDNADDIWRAAGRA